jgi:Tfp pilus assembly protein FimT
MKRSKHYFHGITLVELFAALGTLAVVLSFASAPLERMSARIEVDLAREDIVQTLRVAQRAAIRTNFPVSVSLSGTHRNTRLKAEYSHRTLSFRLDYLPSYVIPESLVVSFPEGQSIFVYRPAGEPVPSGTIRLFSQVNPDYVVEIQIDEPGSRLSRN